MRVALSMREGKVSSVLLLRRLRSGSRKNAHYAAFREVGRVIRTIQLLRHLTDPQMRRRVTAATNKVEAYNGFSDWVRFGNRGVITDNDPVEQEKAVKFNALLTNCLIFHNTLDIADAVRELQAEGWKVEPEDLAEVSPYLTEKIMRFGEYSTHELDLPPGAYEPHLDVDFTNSARRTGRHDCVSSARRWGGTADPLNLGRPKWCPFALCQQAGWKLGSAVQPCGGVATREQGAAARGARAGPAGAEVKDEDLARAVLSLLKAKQLKLGPVRAGHEQPARPRSGRDDPRPADRRTADGNPRGNRWAEVGQHFSSRPTWPGPARLRLLNRIDDSCGAVGEAVDLVITHPGSG
jgi:hypothetical protein